MSEQILNTAVNDMGVTLRVSTQITSEVAKGIDKMPNSGSKVSLPFPPITSELITCKPVISKVSLLFPPVACNPIASEVSLPFPPIACKPIASKVTQELNVAVALKVNKAPTGDEVISSEVQQKCT